MYECLCIGGPLHSSWTVVDRREFYVEEYDGWGTARRLTYEVRRWAETRWCEYTANYARYREMWVAVLSGYEPTRRDEYEIGRSLRGKAWQWRRVRPY